MPLCVVIEVCIIVILAIYIYRTKFTSNVLGTATVAPLRKEYLMFPIDSPLTYFYEPKPNITEEEQPAWLGYTATYTINGDSLNERYDYAVDKPSDTYRIIALGDSFTFGHYVNTSDNWPEQLEDMLNANPPCQDGRRYEVINLGERGYDVQYIAYRYRNRGKKYQPDLIIWHESGSGFSRIKEILHPMVERISQELSPEEQSMVQERPNTDPALWRALDEMRKKYSEESIFEQVYASWLDFFETRANVPVLITTFSYILPQDNAKLKYWTRNQTNTWVYNGIPNIYELGGGLPDGHPNTKGHEIIARSTLQYLLGSRVIHCLK